MFWKNHGMEHFWKVKKNDFLAIRLETNRVISINNCMLTIILNFPLGSYYNMSLKIRKLTIFFTYGLPKTAVHVKDSKIK